MAASSSTGRSSSWATRGSWPRPVARARPGHVRRRGHLAGVLACGEDGPLAAAASLVHRSPPGVQSLIGPMWRTEPEVYACGLRGALPPELRAPRLYAIETLGEGSVSSGSRTWRPRRRRGTSRRTRRRRSLSGAWPGGTRLPRSVDLARMPLDLENYLNTRIAGQTLPMLRDDRTWQHPLVRQSVDERLREARSRLSGSRASSPGSAGRPATDTRPRRRLPAEPADRGPGRVGPLRRPRLGITGTAPIGADLVQLIAGRVESGELDPSGGAAHRARDPVRLSRWAYCRGCQREPQADRRGYRTQLALRCGFTALPLERLQGACDDDPGLTLLFAQRARWARMVLDRVPELSRPIRDRASARPAECIVPNPAHHNAALSRRLRSDRCRGEPEGPSP